MHFTLPNGSGLTDKEYEDAINVDDSIIWPLYRAALEVEDVALYADKPIDNEDQRVYVRGQVDELIYQLTNIRDTLEV